MSIIPYTTGNFPAYRFYITKGTVSREVFPLNFIATSLIDELEGEEVFYRRKFSGSLLFGTNSKAVDESGTTQNRKDDWLYFWNIEQTYPCTMLYLTITKNSVTIPYLDSEIYWEGYFSTTEGEFDIDKCTFEVTPLLIDDYTGLLDKADIQHNILDVSPSVSTRAFLPGIMDQTYTRNRWLARSPAAGNPALNNQNVIWFLADKILPGVNVSSHYFTDVNNPATLYPNQLLYLTIAQKSDIIRPNSSNQALYAMMSWSELTYILWAMFEVKWDYDSLTNTINVEHISWFTRAAGIDLRTQLSCVATNKYVYLKDKMPKYEKFSFMEAENGNFIGVPIWYDSACVDQNPKTNVTETFINVTTDLEHIYYNPTAISDDGFVILCNYLNVTYFVLFEGGAYSSSVKLNMPLSWANLQYRYFRNNRTLIQGYLNNILTTFWTALKTKHQECSAILCDAFDSSETITTELGQTYLGGVDAIIKTAKIKPSGEVKFNLLYGPEDNTNTGVPFGVKSIVITEVVSPGASSTFYAICSQPADGNLVITIQLRCFDVGLNDCVTGYQALNIAIGTSTGNVTINWCHPSSDPVCRTLDGYDDSGAAGWDVSFIMDAAGDCT